MFCFLCKLSGVLAGGLFAHFSVATYGLFIVDAQNFAKAQLDEVRDIRLFQIPHISNTVQYSSFSHVVTNVRIAFYV